MKMSWFWSSPEYTQRLWKICWNQLQSFPSHCYQTVDLVISTLTLNSAVGCKWYTHGWEHYTEPTVYLYIYTHIYIHTYMFAEHSPHVSVWLGRLLCPFTIQYQLKMCDFWTIPPLPFPLSQPLPTCLLGAEAKRNAYIRQLTYRQGLQEPIGFKGRYYLNTHYPHSPHCDL